MKNNRILFFEPSVFLSPIEGFAAMPQDEEFLESAEFPYGVANLASYLDRHGIESRVVSVHSFLLKLDPRIVVYDHSENSEKRFAYATKQIVEYTFDKFPADCIGISLTSVRQEYSAKIISRIFRKFYEGVRILIGGQFATADPVRLFDELSPDVMVLGEGEDVVLELLRNNFDIEGRKIRGVMYRSASGDLISGGAAPLFDLENKSYPVNYELMLKPPCFKVTEMKYQVMASRGCPFKCNFCFSYSLCEGKVRFRKPEDIRKDLEYIEALKISKIFICDNVINVNKDFFNNLCSILRDFRGKLEYMVYSSINKINEDDLKRMRDVGIRLLILGIQHIEHDVLKEMNKKYDIAKLPEIFSMIKHSGLYMDVDVIIGHPGSTFKKDSMCFQYLKKLVKMRLLDSVNPLIFTPFPGCISSKSNQIAIKDRNLKNWTTRRAVHDLVDEKGQVTYSSSEMNKILKKYMGLYKRPWEQKMAVPIQETAPGHDY